MFFKLLASIDNVIKLNQNCIDLETHKQLEILQISNYALP